MERKHNKKVCFAHRCTDNILDGACAEMSLRLPDYATFARVPPAATHGTRCTAIEDPHNPKHVYDIRKLFLIMEQCDMAAMCTVMDFAVTAAAQWCVVEYVPGSCLRVKVVMYWEGVVNSGNPSSIFARLHALGAVAKLVPLNVTRFHVPLTFLRLQDLFLQFTHCKDRLGTDILAKTEAVHLNILPAVTAFIDTGDDEAYESFAPSTDALYAKPTLASLQAAIDVSQHLRVQLKPYQISTIAWALDRERHGSTGDTLGIRMGDNHLISISNVHMWKVDAKTQHTVPCGGFILEEMGMGKTLEMLAIIIASDHIRDFVAEAEVQAAAAAAEVTAANDELQVLDVGVAMPRRRKKKQKRDQEEEVVVEDVEVAVEEVEIVDACAVSDTAVGVGAARFAYKDGRCVNVDGSQRRGGTLIIVPLSLVNQWSFEIETNVVNGMQLLRPLLYHGPGRHKKDLLSSPIVITTYETAGADARKMSHGRQRDAAKANITWRCPRVAYMAPPAKLEAPLQHNDIVSYRDVASEGNHWVVTNLMYGDGETFMGTNILVHADGLVSVGVHEVLLFAQHMVVVGSMKRCIRQHDNALLTVCPTCGYDCQEGVDAFLKETTISPLATITWQRIVLDESHKLQSANTEQFKAIQKIRASCKWCLTGTPMPKSDDNLSGQLKFLDISLQITSRGINPFAAGWVTDAMARHTKRACLLDKDGLTTLPPITYRDVLVQLSASDVVEYRRRKTRTRERYAARADDDKRFVQKMFQLLSEERKACAVIRDGDGPKRTTGVSGGALELPPVPADAINPTDDCPVCTEPISHAVVLPCRHCFCHECLLATLGGGDHRCALCRVAMTSVQVATVKRVCQVVHDVLALQQQQSIEAEVEVEAGDGKVRLPSAMSKFEALLGMVTGAGAAPTLVFTQFDATVYTLRSLLREHNVPCQVLTGSMTRAGRERALRSFRERDHGVLILSLRTAAVGLNLVHASLVVFMEPPMNTGLEKQACGRVHRLGQKNPVSVVHLIAADTVEERIRAFRDMDTSNAFASAIQVGKATVVMPEAQHRLWRQTQLENLMM